MDLNTNMSSFLKFHHIVKRGNIRFLYSLDTDKTLRRYEPIADMGLDSLQNLAILKKILQFTSYFY